MLNQIDADEFVELINNDRKNVVITFFSSYDDSYEDFNNILLDVSEERTDIDFFTIDTEEVSGLVLDYRIEVVPSILLFKRGELIEKLEGYYTSGELIEELERYF